MNELNLDQKQMLKMLAITIVADPLFIKNVIIKHTSTHKLKPDNAYLCEILKPIFDNISTRQDYDEYLTDLPNLISQVPNIGAQTILNSTLQNFIDRNKI